MRTKALLGALLAVFVSAMPAAGSERIGPRPAAHEELAGTVNELIGQLDRLAARWREHFYHRAARGERPLITFMLRHGERLDLSPEQVQSLERLRADFRREAIRRRADLRIAEVDLATLLDTDPVDLGKVEAKIREIERARADLRLARVRTIEQGKAQLTPEQRAKLQALLAAPRHPRRHPGAYRSPRGKRL
ncbi:MAG: Spy/CpxP family protein refolding chaperone [Candidatus Methylomirabilia bacterium]